ncbi:MAG: succinate--CoA ligase subunit alpha [Dehalococcoidia bacterium]
MSILVDESTRIIIQGITGREAATMTRDIMDYGGKVVGGVTPGRGGRDVHGVPVFDTVRQITARERVDASILAVPAGFVRDAAFEAIEAGVPLLVILTERIPRRDVVQILELAHLRGSRVIGPNTMGLISPGKTKVGSVGGPAVDTRKSFVPGRVGIMSRSGGMTTELANLLTQSGLGQSTAISMGGDPIIGSTFVELLPLWEADPETEAVVIFCEPGGPMEADLAEKVGRDGSRLPIVAFIAGHFAAEMPGVRFGHAGSIVEGKADTAEEKARLMREAGIVVAEDFSQIPALVKEAMGREASPRPKAQG